MPSKKRRMSSASRRPAFQRPDPERIALAQRAGDRHDALQVQRQEVVPVAARRRCSANSATSWSDSFGSMPCRRRRPSISGTVSMSNTRVGVMGSI